MKKTKKLPFIIGGSILAFILLIVTIGISINNKAINLEEQINGAVAAIEVQEKRRVDLIYNLADTVQSYAKYEKETMTAVVEARKKASSGNIDEASMVIQAVGEAYPDLKANLNYQQFMTELSTTENLIAEHRNNMNIQVRSYNKFCRTFPANVVLGITGYEKIDANYTEYQAPADAPQNLFGESEG